MCQQRLHDVVILKRLRRWLRRRLGGCLWHGKCVSLCQQQHYRIYICIYIYIHIIMAESCFKVDHQSIRLLKDLITLLHWYVLFWNLNRHISVITCTKHIQVIFRIFSRKLYIIPLIGGRLCNFYVAFRIMYVWMNVCIYIYIYIYMYVNTYLHISYINRYYK